MWESRANYWLCDLWNALVISDARQRIPSRSFSDEKKIGGFNSLNFGLQISQIFQN